MLRNTMGGWKGEFTDQHYESVWSKDNSAACQIFTRKTLLCEWPFRFVNLLIVRNMFRLSMHNLCGMMHMIFERQLPDRCVLMSGGF